jgi:hypothetical protein
MSKSIEELAKEATGDFRGFKGSIVQSGFHNGSQNKSEATTDGEFSRHVRLDHFGQITTTMNLIISFFRNLLRIEHSKTPPDKIHLRFFLVGIFRIQHVWFT